jgi:hypothetical protein
MRNPVGQVFGLVRQPVRQVVDVIRQPVRQILGGRLPIPTGRVRVGFATVTGRSMEPALHDGDKLVVIYGIPPRDGGLALVRLPDSDQGHRPLSVKRVTGRAPGQEDHWWVERDNPKEGVDSWQVGAIPDTDIIATVVARVPNRPIKVLSLRGIGRGRLG